MFLNMPVWSAVIRVALRQFKICVMCILKKLYLPTYSYLLNFNIVGLPAGNDVAPPRNEVWEAKAHNSGVDTGVTAINYDDVSFFFINSVISYSFT